MKRKENNHLAEGEVTGHYHQAVGEDVEVYEVENEKENKDVLMIKAPNGTTVTHQEHGHIEIPAGTYKSGQVLEYDPAEEEARKVRD